ncbi:MAG: hypothetical protein MUO26_00935 [Methanotrichaceae archaeon]|nr:hypothetical protein [Methanotrichaceae archaeon]
MYEDLKDIDINGKKVVYADDNVGEFDGDEEEDWEDVEDWEDSNFGMPPLWRYVEEIVKIDPPIRMYSANGFQLLDDGTSSPAMEYVDLGQYIKPEMPRTKRKLGYVQDLRKRAVL